MSRSEADFRREFYADAADRIRRYGRMVMGVCGGGGSPPYAYTIGNHLAGKPELLIFGLDPRDAQVILNQVSIMEGFEEVPEGGTIDLGGSAGLKVVHANPVARSLYTVQAGRVLETEDYGLIQLLLPDRQGRYPGDPLCAEPYCRAPVLRGDA